MSTLRERRRRLFFALWPTAGMQEALAAAATGTLRSLDSDGRPVPRENLHLTLAFVGAVPESSVRALEEAARVVQRPSGLVGPAAQAGAALEVSFDAIEYWPRAEIVCAAASRAPAEAAAFAEALKDRLSSGGFAPDLKPFRAHVTLARHVRRRPEETSLAKVKWSFSDFALIESRNGPSGSLYSLVASWPLYNA